MDYETFKKQLGVQVSDPQYMRSNKRYAATARLNDIYGHGYSDVKTDVREKALTDLYMKWMASEETKRQVEEHQSMAKWIDGQLKIAFKPAGYKITNHNRYEGVFIDVHANRYTFDLVVQDDKGWWESATRRIRVDIHFDRTKGEIEAWAKAVAEMLPYVARLNTFRAFVHQFESANRDLLNSVAPLITLHTAKVGQICYPEYGRGPYFKIKYISANRGKIVGEKFNIIDPQGNPTGKEDFNLDKEQRQEIKYRVFSQELFDLATTLGTRWRVMHEAANQRQDVEDALLDKLRELS